MRLFVIGHSNKGKTTVLKTLRGERMTKETLGVQEEKRKGKERERDIAAAHFPSLLLIVTVGIDVGKWSCVSRRKNARPINFYTWDFAGQVRVQNCTLINYSLSLTPPLSHSPPPLSLPPFRMNIMLLISVS